MADEKIEIWSNASLPERFRERAYISANEFALYREDAIEYLHWCKKQGYHVLGYEGWMPTSPGPTPILSEIYEGGADFCIEALSSQTSSVSQNIVFNLWVEEDFME